MLGFSAGGHLTVAVGTGWDSGKENSTDPIEKVSAGQIFVPVYAVTNGTKRGRKPMNTHQPTNKSILRRRLLS